MILAGEGLATEISADSPVPLYRQLADLVRKRIQGGELRHGARLPSEAQLGNAYGISRITVRQALSELEREGLLERTPGKGTFVRQSTRRVERLTKLAGFGENVADLGRTVGYHTFRAREESVPPTVADRLQLPNARAFVVDRLLLADGTPVGMHLSYLPLWVVERSPTGAFTQEALDHGSLYTAMEETGAALHWAEEVVEPALAGAEDSERLGIEEGRLLLRVTRTVYDPDDRPLEHVIITYRSDAYTFRQRLYRDGEVRDAG
jgi:GntR family transcriptional regulator